MASAPAVAPSKIRCNLRPISWMRADEAKGTFAGVLAQLPDAAGAGELGN